MVVGVVEVVLVHLDPSPAAQTDGIPGVLVGVRVFCVASAVVSIAVHALIHIVIIRLWLIAVRELRIGFLLAFLGKRSADVLHNYETGIDIAPPSRPPNRSRA